MLKILYAQFYFLFSAHCKVARNPFGEHKRLLSIFFVHHLARSLFFFFFAFPRNWKGERLLLNFIVQP